MPAACALLIYSGQGCTDTKENARSAKPPSAFFTGKMTGRHTAQCAVTGTGKIKRFKAYKRHILTKKSTKRKRDLRQSTILDETNVKNMRKVMPYL